MKTTCSSKIIITWCALFIFCCVFATASGAATFNVTNTGDNGGVNPAPSAGTGTLRQAIVDANAAGGADTIAFDAAVTGNILLAAVLPNLSDDVTITGPGAATLTVKRDPSAATQFRIFAINSGKTVSISGLTISGGTQNGSSFPANFGGGILNQGTLSIGNCTISGNSVTGGFASGGGGIFNDARTGSGVLTVVNSSITGNTAGTGGGIYTSGNTTATVTNSTISGNMAIGTPNAASGFGGGILNDGSLLSNGVASLVVSNSTLSGNSATNNGEGGAIYNDGRVTSAQAQATVSLKNCTLSDNSASFGGGAIENVRAGNNTTPQSAVVTIGSTLIKAGFGGSGQPPFSGTIVNLGGTVTSLGYNLSSDAIGGDNTTAPGGFFNQPTDTRNTDPNLGPLQNNGGPTFTHALICGSFAIDRGKNFDSLTTDQRGTGFNRTFGSPAATGGDGTDIGSFEVQAVCDNPPDIVSQGTISRQQGGPSINSTIAEVADGEQAANTLTVTANGGSSATVNGVTVSNIFITVSGRVSADVLAGCSASQATFTLRATDNTGHFDEDTLTVDVTANPAPLLSYDNASVANGGSTSINPATGPADSGGVSIAVQSQGTYTGTIGVDNTSGVVSISNAGPIGSHTITIRATDNCDVPTDAQFTLNVTNNAPAITAGNAVTRQQGSAGTSATIATVSDPDQSAGSLTVTATAVPSGISVTAITNNSGTVMATVAADCTAALGTNTVGLTVTDSNNGSATANFTVNVTANTAPILTYNNASVANGGSTSINPATGPSDNGSVSIVVQSPGTYTGTISVNATGVVSISNAAPKGSHTITIRATDNCGVPTDAPFTLNVTNNPPYAASQFLGTNEDSPRSITLTGKDVDGDALTFTVVSGPTHGGLSGTAPNLTYTPNADYNGGDSFTFKANDGTADSNTAAISITVFAVNDAPSFVKGPDQTVPQGSGPQTVPNWATNISAGPANESGQSLMFVLSNNNSSLFASQPAVSSNGTLSYTPAADAAGSATVTVVLKDNGGTAQGGQDSSAPQTFMITVTAAPPSPTPTATATATPTATPGGTPTPSPTPRGTPSAAQALNISTRLRVDTGEKVMIGGFIITGEAAKSVVLRGMGPSLVNAGVPAASVLNDPVIELHGSSGALILSNDNWKESPQRAQIEGTVFQPGDDREAVILATLPPAAYTVILKGAGGTSGIGLVEVYDTNAAVDSELANISTRGFVQTGTNVMIGGFMLGGNPNNTRIAIRGLGPSLASTGLTNLLADPTLELHDGNGTLLISNDNWQDDPVSAAALTANGLAPTDPKEAGIFTILQPGSFTAILAGQPPGTGVGLIEIYNLQ